MMSWWLLMFVLLFLVPPVSYGWGYRGWGPPYPRHIQRRRGRQAAVSGDSATFNHEAWGWRGDFVWVVVLIAMCWAITAFWWR